MSSSVCEERVCKQREQPVRRPGGRRVSGVVRRLPKDTSVFDLKEAVTA